MRVDRPGKQRTLPRLAYIAAAAVTVTAATLTEPSSPRAGCQAKLRAA